VSAGVVAGIKPFSTSGDPMIDLIRGTADGADLSYDGEHYRLADVRLLPPIAQPSKNILCIGKNYLEHAAEFARSGFDSSTTNQTDVVPDAPIIFSKAPCTMVGAHENIVPPWDITQKVDYEGELGVVIGKAGRSIASRDAYTHVWGYTVINDVTARDLQSAHKQWLLGKSIDTFCPIGPWIVSADEVDPENLELQCWVNGELRQSANTRDLIFGIPAIIASISASMSLSPGDIIATGTPAGVGIGFDPPKFLQPGDRVRVAIGGLGALENTVV
jgi:2-keto-4-pentenoate hydratase/2-oxohepta-3-ene-1,7-dioic acid hydratase in catechol pathway